MNYWLKKGLNILKEHPPDPLRQLTGPLHKGGSIRCVLSTHKAIALRGKYKVEYIIHNFVSVNE